MAISAPAHYSTAGLGLGPVGGGPGRCVFAAHIMDVLCASLGWAAGRHSKPSYAPLCGQRFAHNAHVHTCMQGTITSKDVAVVLKAKGMEKDFPLL